MAEIEMEVVQNSTNVTVTVPAGFESSAIEVIQQATEVIVETTGAQGPSGPPGPTEWSKITGLPATFPPGDHSHDIDDIPVAPSGTSSATQVVRADDSRLSNARAPLDHDHTKDEITDFEHTHPFTEVTGTIDEGQLPTRLGETSLDARYINVGEAPTAHSHLIADLPVATSGSSNAEQLVRADDSRLSNSRAPTGAAGGDLTGTYPNPTVASFAITDAKVAVANKDGVAETPSMRTLGPGAQQAAAGNHDHEAADVTSGTFDIARIPTATSGDSSDSLVPLANDSRLSDSRTPIGNAGGDLTGTYPNPTVAALAITDAKVAAANKDGAAATPSMRTLGFGASQALAGNTRLDSIASPTGPVSLNSQRITGLADPSSAQDAASKAYVDSFVQGLDAKPSVRVATTEDTTLSGNQTVDGVALAAGNRVLVRAQTDGTENGLYTVQSGAWTRATDADTSAEVTPGLYVFVEEGLTYADTGWVLSNDGAITLGTTSLNFIQFSGAGQLSAGAGMTKTGNVFDVVGTVDRVTVNSDSVDIASTYIGQTSITTLGTITSGTWEGAAIAVANGGTGATDAATARTNLGAAATSHGHAMSDVTNLNNTLDSKFSVAGDGLTSTGGTVNVVGTANRITANANSVDIASTYSGQTSITTLGTITVGTWTGTPIALENGGTGATDADSARAALGAAALAHTHEITDVTSLQDALDSKFSVAGSGLTSTGGTIDAVGTLGRIFVDSDGIDIDSNYAGQTSITTVGSISVGTWNGTAIALAKGGTGATTAPEARTALSAAGVYKQILGALTAGVWLNIVHNLNTDTPNPVFIEVSSAEGLLLDWKVIDVNTIAVRSDAAFAADAVRVGVMG